MLKLKNTPGFARNNLVMTHPHHKQVGQHSDTNRLLTADFVPTDLVLAQPRTRFQLLVHELDRPAFLVDAHDLARSFVLWGLTLRPFLLRDDLPSGSITGSGSRFVFCGLCYLSFLCQCDERIS